MPQAWFDQSRWDRFWEYWNTVIKQVPHVKKEALESMGGAVRDKVVQQLRQRVNDPQGRVARWQEVRTGSRGGYVAVSPTNGETVQVSRTGHDTTSRDLTRYLERGHAVRSPSGRAKRYTPRLRAGKTYVPGRMFYSWAKVDAEKLALKAADEVLCHIADEIDY